MEGHLGYVNSKILPTNIALKYESIVLEFINGYNSCKLNPVWSYIGNLMVRGQLYDNIGSDNEPEYVVLSEDRYQELSKEYYKGFDKGYSNVIAAENNFSELDNESIIRKLFNIVKYNFEKLNILLPEINRRLHHRLLPQYESSQKLYLCIDYHFYEHGSYLTKKDFKKYLVLAFQDNKPPKLKFTFSNPHINNITGIFYDFYNETPDSYGKQRKYAELLGEYFNDFNTDKVMNNFAKSRKNIRK